MKQKNNQWFSHPCLQDFLLTAPLGPIYLSVP